MKTRFKYKSVAPTSFGLTTEEILLADDRELAQYVSVKKLAPYREKEWMVSGRQRSQFRRNLKQKQKQKQGQAPANNIGNSDSANASAYTGKRKRKSSEEMRFGKDGEALENQSEGQEGEDAATDQVQGKKKRLRKKQAARLAKQNGDVPVAEKNARSEAEEKAERRARKLL